ncbi:hypothetical protein FDG2_1660 [Candidatus Protofrankia californiensis]|uniref:Uncharacterized protein n=1 Tax=Candidatus Protofrankia californiensis TaxID=1839754 RepID=A0A1C3NW35_9ACTN|nr:hypothetical protein FDG2_1660 [Candidatus Protofrankia californiensis]
MTTAITAADPARAGSTRTRRFYQIPITPTDPPYDDDPQAGTWVTRPPAGPAATAAPVIGAAAPVVLALPHTDHGDQRQHTARSTAESQKQRDHVLFARGLPAGSGVPAGSALPIREVREAHVPESLVQALPGPGRTDAPGSRTIPSARAAATVVVRAIVEAVTGIRPVAHLAAWTSPQVQADLERLVADNVRHRRHTLRCLRVCEPREGIAEVAAVITRGERVSALALRMETSGSRWRVTALQTDALRRSSGTAGAARTGAAPSRRA